MSLVSEAVYQLIWWTLGKSGILYPEIGFLDTKNTYAEILTPGYLGYQGYKECVAHGATDNDLIILCSSTDKGLFWASVTTNRFLKFVTLNAFVNPGSVSLPVVSGNVAEFLNTTGEMDDSNIALTNIQQISDVVAGRSANIGGSGAGPVDVSVSGATASSVAIASILSSSNPVSIVNVSASSGKISITFSGNPGASAIVNYVVYKAGQ